MIVCGDSKHLENGEAYVFTSQHARHCFCAYGLRIHSRPFHWKMNSFSLGISIPNTFCTEWSDIDTALTAKNAQRPFSLLGDMFIQPLFNAGSKKATQSLPQTLLQLPSKTSLRRRITDQSQMGTTFYQLTTMSVKTQIAYPTEARERQKAREKRAKETGVTLNVQKRKFVENHFDDCGDDSSSIVKDIDITL